MGALARIARKTYEKAGTAVSFARQKFKSLNVSLPLASYLSDAGLIALTSELYLLVDLALHLLNLGCELRVLGAAKQALMKVETANLLQHLQG